MNANQLIDMFTKLFLRKIVNKGVDAGIGMAARRGKAEEELTPAERKRARQAGQMAKRARQAAKVTRRMGRF